MILVFKRVRIACGGCLSGFLIGLLIMILPFYVYAQGMTSIEELFEHVTKVQNGEMDQQAFATKFNGRPVKLKGTIREVRNDGSNIIVVTNSYASQHQPSCMLKISTQQDTSDLMAGRTISFAGTIGGFFLGSVIINNVTLMDAKPETENQTSQSASSKPEEISAGEVSSKTVSSNAGDKGAPKTKGRQSEKQPNGDAKKSGNKTIAATPQSTVQTVFAVSPTLRGEARGLKDTWPFKLHVTKVDGSSGKWSGEIEWTTLDSVNRVAGTLSGTKVEFVETDYIKRGGAIIGCIYTLYLDEPQSRLVGTWKCADRGDVWISLTASSGTTMAGSDPSKTKHVPGFGNPQLNFINSSRWEIHIELKGPSSMSIDIPPGQTKSVRGLPGDYTATLYYADKQLTGHAHADLDYIYDTFFTTEKMEGDGKIESSPAYGNQYQPRMQQGCFIDQAMESE